MSGMPVAREGLRYEWPEAGRSFYRNEEGSRIRTITRPASAKHYSWRGAGLSSRLPNFELPLSITLRAEALT